MLARRRFTSSSRATGHVPRTAAVARVAMLTRSWLRRSRLVARAALLALAVPPSACGSPADAAWNRGEAVAQLVAERSRRRGADSVNLRDLAPFRWERLHLVAPGGGAAGDALGPAWPAVLAAAPTDRPGAQLLVFTAGGDIVAAAALAPGAARFDAPLLGRSYAPDSATFAVRREGGAAPRLSR